MKLEMETAAMPQTARGEGSAGAPIVLVAGGKGGVGKSLVAANLALQLQLEGARVLLCDLDLGLGNASVLFDVKPERTIEDALRGDVEGLAECVFEGPHGLHLLAASSGTPSMAGLGQNSRRALWTGLRELRFEYDIIIADGAAGIGPDLLEFATAADRVLVVTTPQPAALTDAYGLIKALGDPDRVGTTDVATPELFVNQASGIAEAESTASRLRVTCERFLARSPRFVGWLPWSASVAESACSRRPFVLDERSGAALERRSLQALGTRFRRRLKLDSCLASLP